MSPRSIVLQASTPAIPILRWLFSWFFDRGVMRGLYFDRSFVDYNRLGSAFRRQKVLGFNRSSPWPIAANSRVSNYAHLHLHPDSLIRNLPSFGCHYQNFDAAIHIGRGTYLSLNVGIITSNHVPGDLASHTAGREVVIGEEIGRAHV